jgi:glycosyltransferase involved in cell wall biosynthesis
MQKVDRFVYSIPEVTIPVGIEIQNTLHLKNRVHIKNAFLPPILENEAPVPGEIVKWIDEKRKAGNQVAIANAWRLKTHNGQDQYGLDLCIDAAIRLKKMNRNICFVYAVSDPHGDLNIKEYEQRITDNNLWDIFYLQKSQVSFVQLIQHSDIVLRPSNTDGDALTVREGLYFNRPVVASDAVKRPEDALLFTDRNADSFVQMIDKVLTQPTNGKHNGAMITGQEFANFYKEIYQSLS